MHALIISASGRTEEYTVHYQPAESLYEYPLPSIHPILLI